MVPFAIAGVQMHVSAIQPNLPAMDHKLALLTHLFPWVQMVVFSELCAHGPGLQHAEAFDTFESRLGAAEAAFSEMAARHRLWLLPGSVYEREGDRIYNTASVFAPDGHLVGRYRKMFPFRPYEVGVDAGDEFLVFEVPEVGRFGVSICYDMWFPETSRTLTAMGAEALLHPSLTNTIDRDVELAIARSTAATNQCYLFDINGVGAGGYGRSIVCDPRGVVLHQSGSGEEFIPLEIDLARVRRTRERGLYGLGQPLKSFRDRDVDFTVYRRDANTRYLDSLGALEKPRRSGPSEESTRREKAPIGGFRHGKRDL